MKKHGRILRNQQKITAIPRKFHTYIKDIWVLQLKLHSRIGKQPYKTLKHPRFRAAYDFLLVREKAAAETKDLGFWWTDFQKNNEDLKKIFNEHDIKGSENAVFSCGSGVAATVVGMAYKKIFNKNFKIYDGSWTEWALKNKILK